MDIYMAQTYSLIIIPNPQAFIYHHSISPHIYLIMCTSTFTCQVRFPDSCYRVIGQSYSHPLYVYFYMSSKIP